MKWYHHIAGGHTHVRVCMNGAKCGDLCFRNEEFEEIMHAKPAMPYITPERGSILVPLITFIEETK